MIPNVYSPSVSTLYRWVITLSKAINFSPIRFDVLRVDEKFEKAASKFKSDTLSVYLSVGRNSYFANFVVSMNRDTFATIRLIFICEPKHLYSEGLPHETINSKTKQLVESRNNSLALFTQKKRVLKKLSNVFDYIKACDEFYNIKIKLSIEHKSAV